jgi:hypothetical protein
MEVFKRNYGLAFQTLLNLRQRFLASTQDDSMLITFQKMLLKSRKEWFLKMNLVILQNRNQPWGFEVSRAQTFSSLISGELHHLRIQLIGKILAPWVTVAAHPQQSIESRQGVQRAEQIFTQVASLARNLVVIL